MQAIILAAGMGRRLGKLTQDATKCMVKVHGRTLIERSLDILVGHGIDRIVLVVGYKADGVREIVGDSWKGVEVVYVENDVYDRTNNIYSLYLAREHLVSRDTLLLESDLIFDPKIIRDLIAHPTPNLAVVDKYESWMDGTVVTLTGEDDILRLIPKKHFNAEEIDSYFKTVNIYKFSKEFSKNHYVPFLEAYCSSLGLNEYYEQVLRIIILLEKQHIKAMRLDGEKWYEIDDIQDLQNAETVFADPTDRPRSFQSRYGGYWRFPGLRDFCYLVNPYFPTPRLKEELRSSFDRLIGEYPSGQGVQNLLGAKLFGCDPSEILVGNGAAELIGGMKPFFDRFTRVGAVVPTFEEYLQRIGSDKVELLRPEGPDFRYSADDLLALGSRVDAVVLINPDNPSGNFIPKKEVLRVVEEFGRRGKTLILDESFVDFSEEGARNTLLDSEILQRHRNLVVLKSISKSYGVPGLRLGVLACGDPEVVATVRRSLSIWNINSFGEFFLQIMGKYEKDYESACVQIRAERERFRTRLAEIPFLRVLPSQANYFLCEVTSLHSASELTRILLNHFEILVKDCTGKSGFEQGQWVRIAVRGREDNDALVEALSVLWNDGRRGG